ncbi:MAG: hypothetical protein ACOCVY_01810 [Patescibacteria group bacterium]
MKKNGFLNKILAFFCKVFNWEEAEEVFEKIQLLITILIQIAFLASFVLALYERMWGVTFVIFAGIVAIWLPIIFARRRKIHVPIVFELLLTIFIYASLFLGEIQGYYTKFWWWDVILHTGSGMGMAFVGFLIVYSVYQRGSLRANAKVLAIFSFCFAVSLGALWEIFEFIMDGFFDLNMQRLETGVADTMWDLIVDTAGALIVSIVGYFYIKRKKYGLGVFHYFLVSYLKKNNLAK